MMACYAVYDVSRAFVAGREAAAMANGVFFMNLEKALTSGGSRGSRARSARIGG